MALSGRCCGARSKDFRESSGFVAQLPRALQPGVMALAGAGTQSSSGHKPELDKLYC